MLKAKILRYWTYFRRGHSVYLIFIISFLNFIVIQYRLLVEYVPFLSMLFSQLLLFAIAFFLIYIPISLLIGWQDYKRVSVSMDSTLSAKANPYNRDLASAIILLSRGENERVKRLMDKWTHPIGS